MVIGPEVPLVRGVADAVRAAGIACFRALEGGRTDRRIQGLRQGRDDRRRRAPPPARRWTTRRTRRRAGPVPVRPPGSRPGWSGRRPRRRQGRRGHRRPSERPCPRGGGAGVRTRRCWSRSSTAPRSRCSVWSTAPRWCRCSPQDFKRVGDGDSGPNTGGMGAYAPLPWLPDEVKATIVRDVVEPVAAEMVRRGCPFSRLLYAGLAITSSGPAVVEFNCRFGDPETQAVLALLSHPGTTAACHRHGDTRRRATVAVVRLLTVTVVLTSRELPGNSPNGCCHHRNRRRRRPTRRNRSAR